LEPEIDAEMSNQVQALAKGDAYAAPVGEAQPITAAGSLTAGPL
jgi:hypothetical protein